MHAVALDGSLTEILLRKSLKIRQDAGLYIYKSKLLAYYFRNISITLTFSKIPRSARQAVAHALQFGQYCLDG